MPSGFSRWAISKITVAAGCVARILGIQRRVGAAQIAGRLADREDQPVSACFLELPDVVLQVKLIDHPVQVGRLLFRSGSLRLEQVVRHHAVRALRHPGGPVGLAGRWAGLAGSPGDRSERAGSRTRHDAD